MGNLQHFFQYGPVTAVVAFAIACIGAGLGLRCIVRARTGDGVTSRTWLVTAAIAIASGAWTMHLIVLLGFGVDGSPVRYNVPLTLLSLLIAIVFILAGVFGFEYSRSRTRGIAWGGLGIGMGIVAMHYVGMTALEVHATLSYGPAAVIVSIVLGVGLSTLALVVALLTPALRGTALAALLMGAAASATEYAGLTALRLDITPGTSVLPGASAVEFVFPFIVVFGSFLLLSSAFVALSPASGAREPAPPLADPSSDTHLAS